MAKARVLVDEQTGAIRVLDVFFGPEIKIVTSQIHAFCTLAQIPHESQEYDGEVGDRVLSVARNFK